MPIDPILGGTLINAAGAALSGLSAGNRDRKNREAQQQQNLLDREHERKMYALQRQHAVQDWIRENQYNSPLQQMTRLRQAGLNPNLVYGKGADHTAGSIRNVSPQASSKEAQKFDPNILGNATDRFMQMQNMQAQTDNLHAQQNLLVKEGYMKDLNIAGKGIENAQNKFDYNLSKELKDVTMAQAVFNAQKTEADVNYTIDANTFMNDKEDHNFQMRAGEIAKLKATIENIKANTKSEKSKNALLKEEVKLRKMGLNPKDPMYWRLIAKGLELQGIKID